MTGLILGHLVNGIVDRIQIQCLGTLCEIHLAGSCAVLSLDTNGQVLLGGSGYALTQQLGKLGSVLSLLPGSGLVVLAYLRIALTEGCSCHSQVHTYFGALALEVGTQICLDVLRHILGNADHMLGSPGHFALCLLDELICRCLTYGALLRCLIALVNITAYRTYPSFHCFLLFCRQGLLFS